MLLDIRPDHLQIVQTILRQHVPNYPVWAFGSRAKWTAKDHSDLDLCIVSDKPLDFRLLGALTESFSDSDLPYMVDIVDWATTSESFRKIITRDKVVVPRAGEGVSAEWRTFTLGQLGRVVTGKTPKTSDPNNFGGEIPFVTPTDMDGCKAMATTARHLSELGASTVKSSIIPAGSVMVSCIGSDMGKSVIAKHRCVTNQQINSIVVDAQFSSEFIYYNLSRRKAELQHLASGGSTMPILNKGMFSEVKIDLPPLAEQLQIAKTLSALDDRITLLRETNATLEAIAQALFKSWFVDFDPVRAKLEGRAPEDMDEATARLFPDSFEESALGLVPRGWRVGTIGEHTSYLNRGISPKYIEDGGIVVINQKCIRDFSLDMSKARRHDPAQRKVDGRELLKGDILVNSTGVGTLGRVAQVLTLKNPAIVDSHVTVMRAGASLTWNYLGLLIMRRQSEIEGMGEGSTGQTELSRGKLAALKLLVPSAAVLKEFDEVTLPLRERFSANQTQAQTLATLRDTLLPRLISGQLRLPEAQAAAEEALA